MKRILILILSIVSFASFGQVLIDPSASPTTGRINDAISESYTASGTDTYTISPVGSFSYTYLIGKAISVTFPNVNTTSSTLDFDGLGAKNIKKWSSGSLANVAAGDLIGTVRLRYDGTQFVMEGGAGSGGGGGSVAWGTIPGTLSDQTDLQSALDAKTDKVLSSVTYTSNHTLDLTLDKDKLVIINTTSGNVTLTIPTNASQAFPVGYQQPILHIDTNTTPNTLTIAASGGVTISASNSALTSPLSAAGSVFLYTAKRATNTWDLANGTSGGVSSVSSANADISVATGTTTPVLTLNSGSGANQIVKRDGSGNLNATTVTTNANLTGDVTSSGNTTSYNSTVPLAKGGTGLTSFTQGDIPYYVSGTALSKLAKDTNSTRYLSNQGTSNAPSWNQVDLTNGVTGILPVANMTSLNNSRTLTSAGATVQGDNNNIIYCNSATPFNLTVDILTVGTKIDVINKGSATVTLIQGSGVTLSGTSIPVTSGQTATIIYASASAPDVYTSITQNTALSSITAATGSNIINNGNNAQEWQFNSLSSGPGLLLSSSSTAAASSTNAVFRVNQTGANATSTQTTYAGVFYNGKTGTSSTDVAGYFHATGGTNNYAIVTAAGNVGINTTTPTNGLLEIKGVGTGTGYELYAANSSGTKTFGVRDNGAVEFNGSAGTTGSIGQLLQSGGASASPVWVSNLSLGYYISAVTPGTVTGYSVADVSLGNDKNVEMLWYNGVTNSGNTDIDIFNGYTDAIAQIEFTCVAVRSNGGTGTEGYTATKIATFHKSGSSNPTLVGTVTTVHSQTNAGTNVPVITPSASGANVRLSYALGGGTDTYRWTIFAKVTITKI